MSKTEHPSFSRLSYRVKLSYVTWAIFILFLLSAGVSVPVPSSAFSSAKCPKIRCPRTAYSGRAIQFSVSPGSYRPTYEWRVSSGRISSGQYSSRIRVTGVSAGQFCRATVEMDGWLEFCPRKLSCTTRVSALCAEFSVNCPGRVKAGRPATVTANMSGYRAEAHASFNPITFMTNLSGDAPAQVTYNWSVSAGRIKSGQGTPSITIDTTGLSGQVVTATVEIGGLPPECDRPRSCSFTVE